MKILVAAAYALFVLAGAGIGAWIAYANDWGARESGCDDTLRGRAAELCLAPSAAGWAVALAAGCGALIALAIPQIIRSLRARRVN